MANIKQMRLKGVSYDVVLNLIKNGFLGDGPQNKEPNPLWDLQGLANLVCTDLVTVDTAQDELTHLG